MNNNLNICEPVGIPDIQKNETFITTNFPPLFLNDNPSNTFEKIQEKQSENPNKCSYVQSCFLSKNNINKIQNLLIDSVYKNSNNKYRIKKQKHETVLIVMKYIYNFYAQSLSYSIKEQIDILNKLVIKELTPQIINNLKSHEKYLNDISERPKLLELPINNSTTGNMTLPSWLR